MRRLVRDNGLSITLFAAFLIFFVLQSVFGWIAQRDDDRVHGQPTSSYGEYLGSGDFVEATFENWESEFLQIGSYVVLTAWLIQRGSPESKPAPEDADQASGAASDPGQDGAAGRDGGSSQPAPPAPGNLPATAALRPWRRRLRDNGLAITFFALFIASFVAHLLGGAAAYNEEQVAHGQPTVSVLDFLGSSEFWFQSMQNWQSEFFAIALLVLFTIWLRQKGSPQSKPIDDS